MASLLDLDEPWSSDLWLMWLQPETQELLDPANAITSATQAPFPGVELGPIIGKGSFGYVRKGLMGKMMMAVKVKILHASYSSIRNVGKVRSSHV